MHYDPFFIFRINIFSLEEAIIVFRTKDTGSDRNSGLVIILQGQYLQVHSVFWPGSDHDLFLHVPSLYNLLETEILYQYRKEHFHFRLSKPSANAASGSLKKCEVAEICHRLWEIVPSIRIKHVDIWAPHCFVKINSGDRDKDDCAFGYGNSVDLIIYEGDSISDAH